MEAPTVVLSPPPPDAAEERREFHHFISNHVILFRTRPHLLFNRHPTILPQKNCVYFVAKQLQQPCAPEEFGLALARHFVKTYPQTVWKAKVLGERQFASGRGEGGARRARVLAGLLTSKPLARAPPPCCSGDAAVAAPGRGRAAARPRIRCAGQRGGRWLPWPGGDGPSASLGVRPELACAPCACCATRRPPPHPQVRTAYVTADSQGRVEVTTGLKELKARGGAGGRHGARGASV